MNISNNKGDRTMSIIEQRNELYQKLIEKGYNKKRAYKRVCKIFK